MLQKCSHLLQSNGEYMFVALCNFDGASCIFSSLFHFLSCHCEIDCIVSRVKSSYVCVWMIMYVYVLASFHPEKNNRSQIWQMIWKWHLNAAIIFRFLSYCRAIEQSISQKVIIVKMHSMLSKCSRNMAYGSLKWIIIETIRRETERKRV